MILSGYRDGHLVVYSETHIDIFNCATGEWVQTLNIKRAKPLNDSGSLSLCILHELTHLLYLSNVHQSELNYFFINVVNVTKIYIFRRTVKSRKHSYFRHRRPSNSKATKTVFVARRQ